MAIKIEDTEEWLMNEATKAYDSSYSPPSKSIKVVSSPRTLPRTPVRACEQGQLAL